MKEERDMTNKNDKKHLFTIKGIRLLGLFLVFVVLLKTPMWSMANAEKAICYESTLPEPVPASVPASAPASEPTSTPATTTPVHVHDCHWEATTLATATTDGVLSNLCDCGYVKETQVISANSFYLNAALTDIINAPQEATLTFDSADWNSFPQSVMIALSERRDLTVILQYNYEGKSYRVTISAGTPIYTDDRWYGSARLIDLYDGVEITK